MTKLNEQDCNDDPQAQEEKSPVARDIDNLQSTILRLAKDRERLPQPLFWSLFNSRINQIKRAKEQARVIRDALGESES